MKQILFHIIILIILFSACSKSDPTTELPIPGADFIKAADLSFLPQLENLGTKFYKQNKESDVVSLLKQEGMNTVRIRLWHQPTDSNSSLAEVKAFAEKLKKNNINVWLSVHYSDTWADPGNQKLPKAWNNLNFNDLKDSIYNYTAKIINSIHPDYIQIGNEINNGLLFPHGDRYQQANQFKELLKAGISAVRNNDIKCKIMIHYAGYSDALMFYQSIQQLDYDIMALSYYPVWHGKNLDQLQSEISKLQKQFSKKLIIAETAYPFTLDWNDNTNNIIGLNSQLILPDYPASPLGQKEFLKRIHTICTSTNSLGFCYWGAEYVAFDGKESLHGSSWENQALFDFNNNALPALTAFSGKEAN